MLHDGALPGARSADESVVLQKAVERLDVIATVDPSWIGKLASDAARATYDAKNRLKDAQTAEKLLTGLVDAFERGDDTAMWQLLERSSPAVALVARMDEHAEVRFARMKTEAEARLKALVASMPRELPQAFEQSGLHLDPQSRHPRYTFDNQLLQLTIEPKRYQATMQPRNGKSSTLSLNQAVLVEAVKAERHRLLDRDFDADQVVKQIADAIESIRRSSPERAKGPVGYRDLIAALGKKADFKEDEFAVDLGRLVNSEAVAGRPAVRLQPTRTPKNGLLVPGLEDRGYFGFIELASPGGR